LDEKAGIFPYIFKILNGDMSIFTDWEGKDEEISYFFYYSWKLIMDAILGKDGGFFNETNMTILKKYSMALLIKLLSMYRDFYRHCTNGYVHHTSFKCDMLLFMLENTHINTNNIHINTNIETPVRQVRQVVRQVVQG